MNHQQPLMQLVVVLSLLLAIAFVSLVLFGRV